MLSSFAALADTGNLTPDDAISITKLEANDVVNSPVSIAKKSTVTLEKTASTTEAAYEDGQPETVAVGDTVNFTVVTKIPVYANNYTSAVFNVIDTLSSGLALQSNTIKVYADTTTADEDKLLAATAGQWPTTEVVKVGIGPDGKEIYEVTTTLHQGQTKVGALQGATFKLYVADANGALEIKDKDDNTLHLTQYTNDVLTEGKTIVSDATGRLTIQGESKPGIRGLDVGTYYLVEETAPAGYIRYQKAVKVEIIAPKPTAPETENAYWKLVTYTDSNYLKPWDVWELKKYDVKIDGVETASYTFRNQGQMDGDAVPYGDADTIISTKTDTVTGADAAGLIGHEGATAHAGDGKIVNTQGVELPSTGGMGTTILYVGGSILVILAAILLITKRRMNAED